MIFFYYQLKQKGGNVMTEVVTNVSDIFEHGNKHMATKFQFLSPKAQQVVKYVLGKLRKYKGEFFESNATISAELGCSVRTVQLSIRKAQCLGIFQVSERYETVIATGKKRRTSNVIRLLPFVDFEVVKEVTEKVMEVATTIIQKVSENVQKVSKVFTSKRNKGSQKRSYTRTEELPTWFKQEYVPPKLTDDEQISLSRRKNELQQRLRDKYAKK